MIGRTAVAVLAITGAVAEAGPGSAFETGLRIEQREVVVHRGSSVHARVRWDRGGDDGLVGAFPLRWQVLAGDGSVLAEGRRELTAPEPAGDPVDFRIRARVPRRSPDFERATLQVGIESGGGMLATASATVWIQPGRFVLHPRRPPVLLEGVLEAGPSRGLVLRAVVDGAERPVTLTGPGLAAVLRHPDPVGERIRVEGVEAGDTPYVVHALVVEWLDDPPEPLTPLARSRWSAGPVPTPSGIAGDWDSYEAFVSTTKSPRVAETQEEFDALVAEGIVRPFQALDIDFTVSRVVLVTAGNSPDSSFSTGVGEAWFVARTGRTVVRYDVVQHPGYAFFVVQRPFEALVLPRRPGEVTFRRREWVDARFYWPRTPPE